MENPMTVGRYPKIRYISFRKNKLIIKPFFTRSESSVQVFQAFTALCFQSIMPLLVLVSKPINLIATQ